MPQTLLALAAILALSTFALGQQRHTSSLDRGAQQREVDLAATDLARSWVGGIMELAFDEADVGQNGVRFTTDSLSTTMGPEPGEFTINDYDDVDDFHLLTNDPPYADSVAWDGSALPFTVTVTVDYVDLTDPDTPVGTPTLAKRVAVTVRERADAPLGRPLALATLRGIVSPASQPTY